MYSYLFRVRVRARVRVLVPSAASAAAAVRVNQAASAKRLPARTCVVITPDMAGQRGPGG